MCRYSNSRFEQNLFDVDDIGMFKAANDVHLTRQELLEEFFGRQVVVYNLHGEVSRSRQVHRFLDDRERSLAELVSEAISVLQEHHLQVDRAFHVRHRRPWSSSPRKFPEATLNLRRNM